VAQAVAAIVRPVTMMIDEDGNLVSVMSNGEAVRIGRVRGANGKDAPIFETAEVDEAGVLVLGLSNGEIFRVGMVRGADGKDGKDGFALSDFDAEMRDLGRTLILRFKGDEVEQVYELGLATPVYRGVFRQGEAYEIGDLVTFGGSVWHCQAPTTEKPGDGNKAWVLAVKHGRDGKDGPTGERGPAGADKK